MLLRNLIVALGYVAFASSGALAGRPPSKKSTHVSSGAKTTRPARTTSASTTSVRSTGRSRGRTRSTASAAAPARAARPARVASQQAPSPERYKEIQQALADKGYYKGTVDGQWNPDSVDAMKRFQKDQNIDADGKISSLSLIGLGLGPKRATAQSAPPQIPPPPGQEK